MISIEELKAEISYDPETGALTRLRNKQPVYLEPHGRGTRILVNGRQIGTLRAVLGLVLGRFPPSNEFWHRGKYTDLRWCTFKQRYLNGRKLCPDCNRMLPMHHFFKRAGEKHMRLTYCTPCFEKRIASSTRRTHLKKLYNLTPEDYATMMTAQGGVCRICGGTSDRLLHVDHCHASQTVRGLLCHQCNMGLGAYRDNPRLLLRAAQYLLGRLPKD